MRDHLIVLSLSHEHCPVATRERVAVADAKLASVLVHSTPGLKELTVLSTCNRTEYYAVVAAGQCPARTLRRHVSVVSGVAADDLEAGGRVYLDREAVRHVLSVAAGLKSMVVGEPHILGQMRSALDCSRQHGAPGPILGRLGMDALAFGKRVRTETGLARNRSSIPHVAVDLAVRHIGALDGKTAVVVGAGEMGALAAQVLRGAGIGRLIIVNRGTQRGQALAERVSGAFRPLSQLADAMRDADLLVAAAVGGVLINRSMIVQSGRTGRPLVVIDLGMPRQVEPAVAQAPGVTLIDLDALAPIAEERRVETAGEAAAANRLVDAAAAGFLTWWAQRSAVPTIAAMRERAERIRACELERALRRLSHLSERDRNVVAALSAGIVNKMLHEPTNRLRQDDDGELATAAQSLFGLDGLEPVTDDRADLALDVTLIAAEAERAEIA